MTLRHRLRVQLAGRGQESARPSFHGPSLCNIMTTKGGACRSQGGHLALLFLFYYKGSAPSPPPLQTAACLLAPVGDTVRRGWCWCWHCWPAGLHVQDEQASVRDVGQEREQRLRVLHQGHRPARASPPLPSASMRPRFSLKQIFGIIAYRAGSVIYKGGRGGFPL